MGVNTENTNRCLQTKEKAMQDLHTLSLSLPFSLSLSLSPPSLCIANQGPEHMGAQRGGGGTLGGGKLPAAPGQARQLPGVGQRPWRHLVRAAARRHLESRAIT